MAARGVRLLDRVLDRYRDQGYYEGMASVAAVLMTTSIDQRREFSAQNLTSAALQAYSTNGVVFAVCLVRQMLLSQASFVFRNKADKTLYGTEDLRILEYPWPNATSGELWARMDQDVSIDGNAYIWKAEPDRLVRLPPREVSIISEEVDGPSGRYRNIIGYLWDPSMGTGRRADEAQMFTVDEVAHWSPEPDPLANFRGMSWLTPVVREVAADSGMTQYKNLYLDHGTPVLAVKYPQGTKLRPDTVDTVIEHLWAKYGGVGNAFKTLVFDQGADPVLGAGLKDLDFADIQGAGAERICSAGGVDPIVIGLRGAARSVGAAYADALRRFADITCRHLWQTGCASLQKLVPNIPAKGIELWYDTTDIAALQAAETERAQVIQVEMAAILTGVQAGFTRESVRDSVTAGDTSQLVPDPNAPPPGTQGGGSTGGARVGTPPGGGQVLTQAQTPAFKAPQPDSFPTPAMSPAGSAKNPSMNGNGRA